MIVTSTGIVNGIIDKKYGKYGEQFFKGMPTYSLPLEIKKYPQNTRTFAILMEDKDAIPPTGFSWIHWSAANITSDSLGENASVNTKKFVQGTNSWSSALLQEGFYVNELYKVMEGHVLAHYTLKGIYYN
ncbi:MAG: YbhB YbcL family protein [Firmicutes bacterium]|nr:YbhB YbcL family protein [Bacillota bacterium]